MRIAFIGNIANTHFQLVRALRAADVDAHLFVDADDVVTARPENEGSAWQGDLPSWIHDDRWFGPRPFLWPSRARLTRALREFDCVVASGVGPMFARASGRDWRFLATGGDLTVRPFPLRAASVQRSVRGKATAVVIGVHHRRAVRRAPTIWTQPFRPFVEALQRLAVPIERLHPLALPFSVDPSALPPPAAGFLPGAQQAQIEAAPFRVFHPARLVMRADAFRVATGQWKANDVAIRGFAAFHRSAEGQGAVLLLPDSTASPDIADARDLVRDLGIEDAVLWLTPARAEGFTKPEMVALYRSADVVLDDFGAGWFGLVVLESLACGTPVVTHVDPRAMAAMYPWHPLRLAADEVAVARELTALRRDADEARAAGASGRRWVETFHSDHAIVAAVMERLPPVPSGGQAAESDHRGELS